MSERKFELAGLLPMPPGEGPPLPTGMGISWPKELALTAAGEVIGGVVAALVVLWFFTSTPRRD